MIRNWIQQFDEIMRDEKLLESLSSETSNWDER